MGRELPRETELRMKLPGDSITAQIKIAMCLFLFFSFTFSSLMYFLKAAFREFGFRELSGEVRKMIEKGVERGGGGGGGGGGGELVLCVSLNGEDFVRVSLLHNNPSPAFFKLLLSSFLPPHPSFPSLLQLLLFTLSLKKVVSVERKEKKRKERKGRREKKRGKRKE